MAIQIVNIGEIANDGTGDDLRTAFDKVNDNFQELDLRFPEDATGVNLSTLGEEIFVDAQNSRLSFKTIIGGNNVTLSASSSAVTINAADSLDQLLAVTDSGSVTVTRGQSMAVNGGVGITTRASGQNVIIDATDGVLGADGTPTLNAQLNANNNNIINAGSVTASQFYGPLEGLVYGIDIRTIAGFTTEFDFGGFIQEYTSIIEWLQKEIDVDFGSLVSPGIVDAEVDQGTFV